MKQAIAATLGALAVITGLSNSVQARPTLESNSQKNGFAFYNDTALNFESRSVSDDYRKFFGVKDSTDTTVENVAGANLFNPDNEFFTPDINPWQVSEDLTLYVDEPFAPRVDAIPFEPNGVEDDRVEVQTNIIE